MVTWARYGGWSSAALLLAVSTVACEADQPPQAQQCEIRTDVEPIARRFEEFGEIAATSWCGVVLGSGDSRVPGPTDVRLTGILEPRNPDAVRAIIEDPELDFRTVEPQEIPVEIRQLLSSGAQWVASTEFDARVTQGLYTGSFHVDRTTMTVLLDCVNPPSTAAGA